MQNKKDCFFSSPFLSLKPAFYLAETSFKLAPNPVFTCLTPAIAIERRFFAPLKKNSTPSDILLNGIITFVFIFLFLLISYSFIFGIHI